MKNRETTSKGIRPFEPEDVEQASELFIATFPKKKLSKACLNEFFREVYLESPRADKRFPSLVFDNGGRIGGFIGVTSEQMRFRGVPINVAVSSAFMVEANESGKRNPLIGISLLRQFLNGEQDLSVADGANDVTRKIWTKSGGSVAYSLSYTWTRPLQPFQTILGLDVIPSFIKKAGKPLAWIGDQLAGKVRPIRPSKPASIVKNLDTAGLLDLMKTLPAKSVMPDYDLDSLQWVIDSTEKSDTEGVLEKRVVESVDGKTLGWYLYFRKRNSIGRVLQLAALPRSMDVVLDSLIYEAYQNGLAALRGRTEPENLNVFNKRFCGFQGRPWFLVHSKTPEIIQAFNSADVFFSGLEGELWMQTNAE